LDQSAGCFGCRVLWDQERDPGTVEVEGRLFRRLIAFGIPSNSRPVIEIGYGGQNGGYLDSRIVMMRVKRAEH
jgi:hypothetical protein